MAFNSYRDVQARLGNPAPLEEQEIRDLFPWLYQMGAGDVRVLEAQLALLNMRAIHETRNAIQRFDKSSTRLSWVLLAMTFVYTFIGILEWLHR